MKLKSKPLFVLLILLAISSMYISFTFSRYVYNKMWTHYVVSNEFHFESDYLTKKGIDNHFNYWQGEDIYFNIKNFEGSDITDLDISYNVTCEVLGEASSHATCSINGTDADELTLSLDKNDYCVNNIDEVDVSSHNVDRCNQEGYEWHKEKVEDEIYFNVKSTNENYQLDQVEVLIKVESTSPYKKVLKGTFYLMRVDQELEDLIVDINHKTDYDEVYIINTFNEDKCYSLDWDKNTIKIDEDLDNFLDYEEDPTGFINEVHFKINKKSSKLFKFINLDTNNIIKVEDFTIIELKMCP